MKAALSMAIALVGCLFGTAGCGLRPPAPGDVADARIPHACAPVTGIVGAEDITVHQEAGFAYVSSTDRRAVIDGDDPSAPDGRVGHIYRLDLRSWPPRAEDVTPLTMREGATFLPHGIGLLARADGSARLFVINHQHDRDTGTGRWSRDARRHMVEIFDIRAGAEFGEPLMHAGTIAGDERLPSPNDVAPVGERQFFVTNEHGAGSATAVLVNDVFGLNYGSLAYFDGSAFRTVVQHLPFANGVNVIGDRLYVASSSQGTVATLRWEPSGAVTRIASTPLGSGVDNIEVAPGTRALLVAAHPDPLRLALYANRWFGVRIAPSQIIMVRLDMDGLPIRGETILLMDGKERADGGLSAASVAAAYRPKQGGEPRLLMGSIFSSRILACTLPEGTIP